MIGAKTEREAKGKKALALGLLVAALVAACLLLVAKPAHAQFFVLYTVNSTADEPDASAGDNLCDVDTSTPGEQCTLRAAIQDANANATTVPDLIDFNIPGSGVKTISPGSSLPVITEPVIIDGYTQPGASENTLAVGNDAVLRIRLDGSNAGGLATGLNITANDSVVRGLSITRFSNSAGISLSGADNTRIEGNFLGTSPGGTGQDLGNGFGLDLQSHFSDVTNIPSNNTVGGTSPEVRNLISGNSIGVEINRGGGNKVIGNYIGTTKSGTADLGNGDSGVLVSFEGANNTIGGKGAARNTIAFNGGDGVQIGFTTSEADVTGNSILANSIFSNADLGIDLGGDGITLNDGPGDLDTGPNNLQNFPVVTSAKTGQRGTTIKGTLEGIPSSGIAAGYNVQFFSSPKGTKDEGKKFIGERVVVDGNDDGIMPFTFKPSRKVRVGMFVTATATYDPTDDTSEFSAPKKVRPA